MTLVRRFGSARKPNLCFRLWFLEGKYVADGAGEAGALDDLNGHSITYWIAAGPRAGQVVPARTAEFLSDPGGAAQHEQAGSSRVPASTLRPTSGRSSSGFAAV